MYKHNIQLARPITELLALNGPMPSLDIVDHIKKQIVTCDEEVLATLVFMHIAFGMLNYSEGAYSIRENYNHE